MCAAATSEIFEYMCPQCGEINTIAKDAIVDMYKEQLECCSACHRQLEVTAANGVNNQINLVVEVAETDAPPR